MLPRYRLTLECGAHSSVSPVAFRQLIRDAYGAGWPRTRVPGGYVVTLPGGALVALIREAAQVDLRW